MGAWTVPASHARSTAGTPRSAPHAHEASPPACCLDCHPPTAGPLLVGAREQEVGAAAGGRNGTSTLRLPSEAAPVRARAPAPVVERPIPLALHRILRSSTASPTRPRPFPGVPYRVGHMKWPPRRAVPGGLERALTTRSAGAGAAVAPPRRPTSAPMSAAGPIGRACRRSRWSRRSPPARCRGPEHRHSGVASPPAKSATRAAGVVATECRSCRWPGATRSGLARIPPVQREARGHRVWASLTKPAGVRRDVDDAAEAVQRSRMLFTTYCRVASWMLTAQRPSAACTIVLWATRLLREGRPIDLVERFPWRDCVEDVV